MSNEQYTYVNDPETVYTLIGTSKGAGPLRNELVRVYVDQHGQLYHRTPEDFEGRMIPHDLPSDKSS